ncbi:MAG: YfiR/HmsC family protein [Vulcanimicrobiaceae bacterium]
MEGGKVRFEVNVTNAANAGLTLSADLLQVALAVRKES